MATDHQLGTVLPLTIPRPRSSQRGDATPAQPPRVPRPRPRSQYWDYRSATWRSPGPALPPSTAH
jgi:hypothetical protein